MGLWERNKPLLPTRAWHFLAFTCARPPPPPDRVALATTPLPNKPKCRPLHPPRKHGGASSLPLAKQRYGMRRVCPLYLWTSALHFIFDTHHPMDGYPPPRLASSWKPHHHSPRQPNHGQRRQQVGRRHHAHVRQRVRHHHRHLEGLAAPHQPALSGARGRAQCAVRRRRRWGIRSAR